MIHILSGAGWEEEIILANKLTGHVGVELLGLSVFRLAGEVKHNMICLILIAGESVWQVIHIQACQAGDS